MTAFRNLVLAVTIAAGATTAALAAPTAPAKPAASSKPSPAAPLSTTTKTPPVPTPRLDLTEWRYRDGLEPNATAPSFDDSKWEVINDAAKGRGNGGASAGWYRIAVTIPEKLGSTPVAGKPLQLVILPDEYAEVWIDGDFKFQLDPAQPPSAPKNRSLGYEIAGFNKANVIQLGPRKPGDKISIAVLVINGPIAKPIGKYAIRSARLEFAPAR
jgi:hypothetical protein